MSQHDRISGRTMAQLLGLGYPGAFNAARLRMQRVWNPETNSTDPYPLDRFETAGTSPREAGARKQARKAFETRHILTVPEWGGLKYPGTEWSYSRTRGEALRTRGPEALSAE